MRRATQQRSGSSPTWPPARYPLTLGPSRLADSVTVTAARGELPISRSIQSVTLLSDEDQQMSPALTLDDFLRRVPGFTLFRRTSSLVAHPTAQGVSLRGVGPSGASRSLVLADGIPLNDPFGGWVYWSRVPRLSIDRTEILRGGASELYGTDALGGVIQVFRRTPASQDTKPRGLSRKSPDQRLCFPNLAPIRPARRCAERRRVPHRRLHSGSPAGKGSCGHRLPQQASCPGGTVGLSV